MPYTSPYKVLITEGNLYESSVDILMNAYSEVPLPIRRVFEEKGFLIKMTEWDITKEAYEEYGDITVSEGFRRYWIMKRRYCM